MTYSIKRHTALRRSFALLPGLGTTTEKRLWKAGFKDWQDLATQGGGFFPAAKFATIQREIDNAELAWQRDDLFYFANALPAKQRWRVISGGFDDIAYFDIEATGARLPPYAHSTAVTFLFRGAVLQEYEFVKKRELIDYILQESSMLCTFNGGAYDIPFLASEFSIPFEKAHVDLCPWLRRQGFKGGLKAIQKDQDHIHQRSSLDLSGYDAVRLWRLYEQGIEGALPTLLTYNAEDALILEPLLTEAFNREVENYPELCAEPIPYRPLPSLPTRIDPHIYALLRARTTADVTDPLTFLEISRSTGD